MTNLIGEYECKLDSKGRFALPSGLKKQIHPSAQETFVMNRGFEGCLVLYPMDEWEKEAEKLEKLNLFRAKDRRFYRQFHNGATVLNLDGQGRLLLPKKLASSAEIDKEVVLFAFKNRIEVWDKAKYNQEMEEDLDDFEGLAEEVMGDDSNED